MKPAPDYVPGHGLLKGKSVLVTAAAGVGIGYAAAKRAAEEGCRALFVSDVHERRLNEAVENLKKETGLQNVFGQLCDVSKDEEWHKVIDVTLTGTFRMTRAMLKAMQPRGKGVIVNNASVLGWRAQKEQAHYAAAKAGVMAFTRCSALEAADFGVRINAVAPSIAFHAMLKKSASEELLKELAAKEAFGRGAEPWEVANTMIFLASDYSSYMTGEVISVSSQHA